MLGRHRNRSRGARRRAPDRAPGLRPARAEVQRVGYSGLGRQLVDRPRIEGSGKTVSLDGDAALDSYASGTTWPAPDYYDGPRRLRAGGGGAVDEVYVAGTFEGYTQVLAGVDSDRVPFRVMTREAPSRLVVDVLR